MANIKCAAFNYFEQCIIKSKKIILFGWGRYSAGNFQITLQINWTITLFVIASILFCQFAEPTREISISYGKKRHAHCWSSVEKPMKFDQETPTIAKEPTIKPENVLSRLETAAILRDNLITALGRVLLICLDDNARVPFQSIHNAVRFRRVAAYELLRILPVLRNKPPQAQFYKLLRMLERVNSRFISGYASLCVNVLRDDEVALKKRVSFPDMLLNVDAAVIDSISRDRHRAGKLPLSLQNGMDFVLRAARNDSRFMNLRTISAVLLNYPTFDLTDPEVHGAMRFVAKRMRERSRPEDLLLHDARDYETAENLLRAVLERLEVDELSSDATKEASSLLLQNLGRESYPPAPSWKHNLKKLLMLTSDRYPIDVTVVAKYLVDHLDDSHLHDLDIGFYETDSDHARLQVLSRLYRKPNLQHLRKPLSLLITFVSQKLMNDADHEYTVPISFYEVNDYLNSFDTPCVPDDVRDAMNTMRSHLSKDLPWSYAFQDRQMSDNPWELSLSSLAHLKSFPLNRSQAIAIDNFVYKGRVSASIGKGELLYSSGIVFQRDDSMEVKVDFYSLLACIPNVFKDEKFIPLLNFLSKPNVLDVLGYEFNKFDYETPRDLLLALLKKTSALPLVKSDESLFRALQHACNYLEEPLLINLYTQDLQMLLKHLPDIENDARYLPLKILFKKQNLLEYLSPTFSLAHLHTPMEKLLLILKTVSLTVNEPKLSDALNFALENLEGSPLPVRVFNHDDFVYLLEQLLSHNKMLQTEILTLPVYTNISNWNVSVSGAPENVLARALRYPVHDITSDKKLAALVKRAEEIWERNESLDIKSLKKRTLEALLGHLPNGAYVKPVILLLKANLRTLVPNLNLTILENISERDPRDALIALLKNLTESRVIRAEKLLLDRIEATLNSLKHVSENKRQTPIVAYLIQILRDPNDVRYQPLLREMMQLGNVTISLNERHSWLQIYLQQTIAQNKTEELREAATMVLREINMDYDGLSENLHNVKARFGDAVSVLPTDPFTEPLRQLLTPDWMYSVLPEDLRNTDSLDKEELLLTILRYIKRRTDIASNPVLTKAITDTVRLIQWRRNVESLKSAVVDVKTTVYDPMKNLLTVSGLNKLKVIILPGESATKSLLELLQYLLLHPAITKNSKISKLLRIVRQDLLAFRENVDLLAVLDDVGIPHTNELAPIRLFLLETDISKEFGRTVFATADPKQRYRTLLDALRKRRRKDNDAQFLDALSLLRNITPSERKPARTLVSDLRDIANAIPHRIKEEFKNMEYLFNNDTLSHLTSDNEIVESHSPLTTMLLKIADLPKVSNNYTAASELERMHHKVELLGNYSIISGFQLRPLLLVLEQVQQVNVDFIKHSVLSPKILNYVLHLDTEEVSNATDDCIEILKNVTDHLLHKGSMYLDDNMQTHLQSFERAMALTLGSDIISKVRLTGIERNKMLALIPHKKMFAPIRKLLQSKNILEYESTDWKRFPSSMKKLRHLLLSLEASNIKNKDIYESASRLRRNLEKRFNFLTEQDVANMYHILTNLETEHDLSALKIFLTHDNMIKYLPASFRCNEHDTPIGAFCDALDNLLQVPSLKQQTFLYDAMKIARQSLHEQNCTGNHSTGNVFAREYLSKDLEFVNSLNMFELKLRNFLNPEKLVSILPKSFTFQNRVTFKTKASHLLRHLLDSNTEVRPELEKLLRQVMTYPDVPNITSDDLMPLLNILLSKEKVPHIKLVKMYLKPSTLIRLLPGNFNIKQTRDPTIALHNILSLLNNTVGSAKSKELEIALDALLSELDKSKSNIVREKSRTDINDIKSLISEIPFKQYKQISQLEDDITPAKIISSLPSNFQLTKYKTKKLQLLAIVNVLSINETYRSSLDAINFTKRIVSEMPDVPMVNDTEIKELLLSLPLDTSYVMHLVKNCKVTTLTPYLPIHFDLSSLESRKTKMTQILRYCELANIGNVNLKRTFSKVKTLLKMTPDFNVTRDHLEVLIGTIPCTNFSSIKLLLRFLSKTDVTLFLRWNLDLYETSHTFKLRILHLLAALRNVRDLRSDRMLRAFESLETNAKSLPDAVQVTPDHIAALKSSKKFESCSEYMEFVTKVENLIKIMPPTYRFRLGNSSPDDIDAEWASIMYFSTLFLREIRADGVMKDAFEACRDQMYTSDKDRVVHYLKSQLNRVSFKEAIIPLRLYVLGHADSFTPLIDNVHRGYLRGTISQYTRLVLREFLRGSELPRSKSLIDSMEVFLHNYMITQLRDTPSRYEVDRAISEIPNDDGYNDIRLLMQCRDVQTPIMERNLSADGTTKQLLLDMLRLVDNEEIDQEMRRNLESLELHLEKMIREEEANYVLKQMRDYRYHVRKLKPVKMYLVRNGLEKVLGDDYRTKYPFYKDRLIALNGTLMTATNLASDLLQASKYLNKILKNEVKIRHIVPRTLDEVNLQTLFFALPNTRDERLIRGIIKFFSDPNLPHKLNLPKDPFEYETKGQLLQTIINVGMGLESVQEDTEQQEALKYFSDKILISGHGAQPIELKKNARDFNVTVDLYGVMKAIDYSKANVTDAVRIVTFVERNYNLMHAMGFSHTAYATRGTYLKALLEHLVNVSQVSDDVKRSIKLLIPAVWLDGPGDEAVDLNDDIIRNKTDTRTVESFLNVTHAGSPSSGSNTRRADLSYTFKENEESLKFAINNMFDSVLSSQEFFRHVNEQSSNTSTLNNITNTQIMDIKPKTNPKTGDNGLMKVSNTSSDDANVIPKRLDIKYTIIKKAKRIRLKDRVDLETKSSNVNQRNGRDVLFKLERRKPLLKLSSEEQLRNSHRSQPMYRKRIARGSTLQSNFDNSSNLFFDKELLTMQTTDERRTVKKDLSRSTRKIP